MTVAELIERLRDFSSDAKVLVSGPRLHDLWTVFYDVESVQFFDDVSYDAVNHVYEEADRPLDIDTEAVIIKADDRRESNIS